jgi:pimeloyl-ACP methyl ester carboxylesterase
MAEVHVNGVRLYYEEHGHGDPILCIHGTSSSGGGHFIDPGEPDVLKFVGGVLGR